MEESFEILKTPKIENAKYERFIADNIEFQNLIDNFVIKLQKELTDNNLKLLYSNLGTLKINYKRILLKLISDLFRNNIVTGQYYLDDNTISIFEHKKHKLLCNFMSINSYEYYINLYHELLHMSSTIVDKGDNIAYSGFSQIRTDYSIGVALDDGYTELLLYRFFNIDRQYLSYTYEIAISEIIENIISKDKMFSFYFGADLYSLCSELKMYNSQENIEKFLIDLDSLYVLEDYRKSYKKDMVYYHNEIENFILCTYRNKLISDLNKGIITKERYDMKLENCLSELHKAFECLELGKAKIKKK